MDISALTSTTERKIALGLGAALLVLLLCLASAWGGYSHGRTTATAEGEAKYNRLVAQQANANRLASDTARKIVDAEVIRRDELERELSKALGAIETQSSTITKGRITDASHAVAVDAGRCSFGPGWVGLFNEAWGFGLGAGGAAAVSGPDGASKGVSAAQAGEFRQGGVTPEDIQVVNRDNARICRELKTRYLKLIEWAEGLPQSVNATEGRP
jgi:hypothetical protein